MASKAQQSENKQSTKVLEELFSKLSVSKAGDESKGFSQEIATFINGDIEEEAAPTKFVENVKKMLSNKKDAALRQNACDVVNAIASHSEVSPIVQPYLVDILPQILNAVGDKIATVKVAAQNAALSITKAINPNAVKVVIPHFVNSIHNTQKWPEKMTDLECIEALAESAPVQTGLRVPDLIPIVSEAMWDTKPEVKKKAYGTMEKVCQLISNKDIERFIPELIKCIAKPENVPETVHLLGATTFVTDVHEPTLAIMTPLLERGLKERETAIKRKSAVIIDNMCKLVEDPNIVASFLPKLMPQLNHNYENLADPEAREKTKQGLDTLTRVGAVQDGKIPERSDAGDLETVLAKLKDVLSPKHKDAITKFAPVLTYIAAIGGHLVDDKEVELISWTTQLGPYIRAITGSDPAELVDALRKRSLPGAVAEEEVDDEDEGADILCDCTFNLAYGAKILLNQTSLKLIRGQRYALLGANGTGKTTLMRAINNEQVEGFPKQSEVKTVFVEHDLDSADTELTVIDWTMMKLKLVGIDTSEADVRKQLAEFGFTEEQVDGGITALSGGWRMKLALCRAVFEKPDILLLDEPTNHLDVKNVKWLEDYLINSPCTSIIISHDSKFLDNVIQHVYHYERFKLKRYKGTLSEFVKKLPSAKSYYELGAGDLEFKFPEPGFLEGVKTKAKAIIRVNNMSFQYEGTKRPQIEDVTFQVSLGSRIAVIGPNGAGKSTLVNVLTGELIATTGIAHIRQDVVHHLSNHLDKTPSEYIQWRFATGEDRETMDRANKILTTDDEAAMNHIYRIEGTQRRVIGIHSRRKFKNSYEYECSFALGDNVGMKNEKWTPMMTADNAWIPRNEIIQSHQKMVAEVDTKEALASGQFRPLVRKEIEAHGAGFGLDAELISHSRMRGLSGGQRVKVVLAACTWQRPHLIVLDEPTNYLDRDSLGALSKAIKSFEGGVVIISHSSEFSQGYHRGGVGRTAILTNLAVLDGRLTPSGHNWVQGQGAGPRLKQDDEEEEKFDAMGNKIESTKKKAKLSSAELRKKKKDRMARRKRGEEVFTDEDE